MRKRTESSANQDEQKARSKRRWALLWTIGAGTGLGAVIGLVAGYLSVPRSRSAPEASKLLSAWKQVASELALRLQVHSE